MHSTFDHNFGKSRLIYKIFHCHICEEILYIETILHPTLRMFLHYLLPFKT